MTEDQKELVTLAAKAMGYEGEWYSEQYEDYVCAGILPKDFEGIPALNVWNPITSDSDCFHMETELEIDVKNFSSSYIAGRWFDGKYIYFTKPYGSDKAAARRLASTRVAAEIQRRKESKG